MANSRPANVRSHRRGGDRRRTSPWLAASIVAVLVLGGMTAGYVYLVHRSCSGNDHALIAASQDVTPILETLSKDWAATKPAVAGRCVSVSVEAKDSALMATELGGADWDATATDPAPDVWVPASSVWIRQAATKSDAERRIPDRQPSLARTPTVIAMPKTMATAIGWPDKVDFDWPSLGKDASDANYWKNLGHSDWGHFQLDMTNPTNSTAGLLTLMATADADGDGNISGAEQAGLLTLKQTMNKYLSDTSDVTQALSKADASSSASALQTVSAFPALEQDVVTYNKTDPKEPLVAIYPKSGSYDADHPYLILTSDAPWVKRNPGGSVAAAAFLSYARSAKGRDAFLAAGFRDSNRVGGSALVQNNGVSPVVGPLPRAVLVPDSVNQTLTRWTAITRPSNVLLVVDVSGSMNNIAAGKKTRLDLAKAAATAAIANFSDDSNVGFWVFSGGYPGNKMYKEIVPLGTLGDTTGGKTRKQQIIDAIQTLKAPGQQTGLYDAVAAAQADVVANYKNNKEWTNMVVLMTDGQDVGSSIDLNALRVKLTKNRQSDQPVPVVTIAYGNEADVSVLNQISRTSNTISLSATGTFDINKVLLGALFGAV